jgi:hypothetical protein
MTEKPEHGGQQERKGKDPEEAAGTARAAAADRRSTGDDAAKTNTKWEGVMAGLAKVLGW